MCVSMDRIRIRKNLENAHSEHKRPSSLYNICAQFILNFFVAVWRSILVYPITQAKLVPDVQCGERDLHSGSFGGIIHEPMTDLIALLDSLVDTSGRILIPGVYDDVASLTEEEKKLYEAIEFDLEEYKNNSGVKKFLYDTKEEILSHLWRYPSLSIHGIEGAFHEPGIKTVIPARVIGKFSIRQVPHMDISVGEHQVIKYLEDVFSKRNSPNKLKVSVPISAMPWVADINDPLYTAARMAIKTVFGQNPEMIRDGATIPIAQMFQNITRKSVMMLPIGAADDAEHSQKEKISRLKLKKGAVKDERRN
ncbi:beta-Ala-His dipeptidase [Chelonoidis abingdonii]|uniref:beta-Ala-His dipeptidase n=1 Tax=Chelonoidis abingdonii TaxID=106734 RepID=UPI003F49752E